jgi:hypothetical protein
MKIAQFQDFILISDFQTSSSSSSAMAQLTPSHGASHHIGSNHNHLPIRSSHTTTHKQPPATITHTTALTMHPAYA